MKVSRSGYYKWLKTKDTLNNYYEKLERACEETDSDMAESFRS